MYKKHVFISYIMAHRFFNKQPSYYYHNNIGKEIILQHSNIEKHFGTVVECPRFITYYTYKITIILDSLFIKNAN